MLRNGERKMGDLHPCAGITLIRFYGFNLSSPVVYRSLAPRGICIKTGFAAF